MEDAIGLPSTAANILQKPNNNGLNRPRSGNPSAFRLPIINSSHSVSRSKGTSAFKSTGRDGGRPRNYCKLRSKQSRSRKVAQKEESTAKTSVEIQTESISEPMSNESSISGNPDDRSDASASEKCHKGLKSVLPAIAAVTKLKLPGTTKDVCDIRGDGFKSDEEVCDISGEILPFTPSVIPSSSFYFQQAMTNMDKRDSDPNPGDLIVRRSSLKSALIEMGALQLSGAERNKKRMLEPITTKFPDHPASPSPDSIVEEDEDEEVDTEMEFQSVIPETVPQKQRQVPKIANLKDLVIQSSKKVKIERENDCKWGRKVNRNWNRGFMKSYNEECNKNNIVSNCGGDIIVHVIDDEGGNTKKLAASKHGNTENTTSDRLCDLSQRRVTKSPMSMKTVGQITKMMSVACASSTSPGINTKSSNLLASEVNEGRLMNRARRDSMRLVKQTLKAVSKGEGDTSEILNFEELRNCRYLRQFRPSNCDRRIARRSSLLGFNEI